MNPLNDPPAPVNLPPRSINRRSVVLLLLPSIGFIAVAIGLIVYGNTVQTTIRKTLGTQSSVEASDKEFEHRLSSHDPELTPERIMQHLKNARRVSESWKEIVARIGGTVRAVGLWALVPIALQIYVIVRVAMQRQTKTG
jgi:hypothetical protein